ncbi:hypothetical protein BV898_02478 [Hypsibius exemplaris]|uniref:Uncharacterized protein n=1 Tax=Hypsibius exemplaris TaxID=2072580 RepID=A0A1W0X8A8_HYPEX|nr:hypothetical protein BV898_02478 [Hypsibius exemplaris]
MLIKGIVILTCFFVDSSSSQQEQFSLADSGYCQYDAPRPYYQASCSNASVPMDLDFTGLPERLTRLLLTNLTVHHTYSPISPGPSYADLQRGRKMTVHLFEIIYVGLKNNTRLPFSQLLQHVASIIISLTIEQTFIGDLGNGDLEGFLALTELRFVECGIASLHPKLFYPLAYSNRLSWIPSELLQPGARSILRSLDLQRNKLRLLKWEVLRPISSSIEVISVDDNEVNEIVEPEYGAMNNFQKLYYFSIHFYGSWDLVVVTFYLIDLLDGQSTYLSTYLLSTNTKELLLVLVVPINITVKKVVYEYQDLTRSKQQEPDLASAMFVAYPRQPSSSVVQLY